MIKSSSHDVLLARREAKCERTRYRDSAARKILGVSRKKGDYETKLTTRLWAVTSYTPIGGRAAALHVCEGKDKWIGKKKQWRTALKHRIGVSRCRDSSGERPRVYANRRHPYTLLIFRPPEIPPRYGSRIDLRFIRSLAHYKVCMRASESTKITIVL